MSITVQIRHAVAPKKDEYNAVIEHSDYKKFAHCRRCQRNADKKLIACPRCGHKLAHSTRYKNKWPHLYKVHRY